MIGKVRIWSDSPAQIRQREIARLLRGATRGPNRLRPEEQPRYVALMKHTVIACAGCGKEIVPYDSAIAQYSNGYLGTFYWHTPKCRVLEAT